MFRAKLMLDTVAVYDIFGGCEGRKGRGGRAPTPLLALGVTILRTEDDL